MAVLYGRAPGLIEPGPSRAVRGRAGLSTDSRRTTRWPEIGEPCLVLAFEHDVDSAPEKARQAASIIPRCEYREIAGSGHIGIVTHADEVTHHLITFFARH